MNLGDPSGATTIRKAIKEGNDSFAQKHLDQDVWKYIQKEGLYR